MMKNPPINDIITQNESRVKWSEKKKRNIEIANKFLYLAKTIDKRAEDLLSQGESGQADLERLKADFYRKRGFRMKDCSKFITMSVCPDCGRSVGSSASLCRDRVCPTCAWRLSAKQSAEMLYTLTYINDIENYTAAFLTLTVENCAVEQLEPTLKMMSEAWHRMLAKRKNKDLIVGTARSAEITYNQKSKTFHPHFHIIMLLDGVEPTTKAIGEMNAYFNEEWRKAARLIYQPITDLRLISTDAPLEYDKPIADQYRRAILETFKYTIKDDQLADMPLGSFRYYVDAINGKRLVNYTGVVKEARQQLDYCDDLEAETTEKRCDNCSAEMISAVYQWSFAENTYKRFVDYSTAC